MALDSKAAAAMAMHRFGLGPRAGTMATIAADPRGALLSELDRPGAGLISDPQLSASDAAARAGGMDGERPRGLRVGQARAYFAWRRARRRNSSRRLSGERRREAGGGPAAAGLAAIVYSAACMSAASMKPPDWRRHSAA